MPGCSGIIYGTHNVVVFQKLADGLSIFTICFLCKLPEYAMGVAGHKIYYSQIHWLY